MAKYTHEAQPASFTSDFAILDVKKNRAKLARRIEKGEKIPVVIVGMLDTVWGNDDGISREFSVKVIGVDEIVEIAPPSVQTQVTRTRKRAAGKKAKA